MKKWISSEEYIWKLKSGNILYFLKLSFPHHLYPLRWLHVPHVKGIPVWSSCFKWLIKYSRVTDLKHCIALGYEVGSQLPDLPLTLATSLNQTFSSVITGLANSCFPFYLKHAMLRLLILNDFYSTPENFPLESICNCQPQTSLCSSLSGRRPTTS